MPMNEMRRNDLHGRRDKGINAGNQKRLVQNCDATILNEAFNAGIIILHLWECSTIFNKSQLAVFFQN